MDLLVPVVTFCCGIAVAWATFTWRSRRASKAAVASLHSIQTVFHDAEQELQRQRNETDLARRQRDEYFGLIEGVVREAAAAKELLVRQGASHGAAQAMMLREIESLATQYRALAAHYRTATGQPAPKPEPRLNPVIRQVADDFRSEFSPPVPD